MPKNLVKKNSISGEMYPLYREIRYDTTAAVHIWRVNFFQAASRKKCKLKSYIGKKARKRETNAKEMSRKELKMAKKGKFVKE
jgi:hypothetical protein